MSGSTDLLQLRGHMLDEGVPQSDVDTWQHGVMGDQQQGGMAPADIDKFWGVQKPDTQGVAQAIVDHMPPDAHSFSQGLSEGFGHSVIGTYLDKAQAPFVLGKDPGFSTMLGDTIGRMADAPFWALGGIMGAQVGAVAGAASGLETGPGALIPGGVGAAVGAGAGAFALPAYLRQGLVNSYQNGGPQTWRDWMGAVGKDLWSATQAGAVGAVAGTGEAALGEAAAGAGMGAASQIAAKMVGFNVGMTGMQVAMTGHVPDASSFAMGTVLGIGLGLAGHMTVGGRLQLNETGHAVEARAQDIYSQYGIQPDVLGAAMRQDRAVRTDVLAGFDADMQPVQPALAAYAPSEPTVTYHGSGALFHQFGDEHLDSGEGSQARGYGHYVAESKEVGEHYQQAAASYGAGHLYQVANHMPSDQVIDQDTTFREQPQPVQAALHAAFSDEPELMPEPNENMDAWRRRVEKTNRRFGEQNKETGLSPPELSRRLLAAGVRGYKYLDQDGRPETGGTRNHVAFNPADLEITHVNGEPLEKSVTGNAGEEPVELRARAAAQAAIEHTDRNLTVQGDDIGGWPPNPPEPPAPGEGGEQPRLPAPGEPMPLDVAQMEIASHIVKAATKSWWTRLNPAQFLRGIEAQLAKNVRLDRMLGTGKGNELGVEDYHRLVYGSAGRASVRLKYGTIDPGAAGDTVVSSDSPENALRLMLKQGGNYGEFERFLLAKRYVGRVASDAPVETGINPEAMQVVADHPDMLSRYGDAADMIRRSRDNLLDYGVASGSLSSTQADAMKSLDPYYITYRRAVEPDYNPPRAGRTFGFRDPVKKISGSDLDIVEPIHALYDNYQFMQAMFDRNRANLGIVDRVNELQLTQALFAKIGEATAEDTESGEKLMGELQDSDGHKLSAPESEALRPFLLERALKGRYGRDTFTVRRNGAAEVWKATDPGVAEMMNQQFASMPTNIIDQIFTASARVLKAGITLDPAFALRATGVHGQVASSVDSAFARAPFRDIVAGWGDVSGESARYKNWLANGGGMGVVDDFLKTYLRGEYHDTMEKSGVFDRVLNGVQHPIHAFRTTVHMLDAASRVGMDKRLEQAGFEPMKRAAMARRAYMDHAEPRNAAWAQALARWTPFMDAGFRDLEQFGRAMRERPGQTLLRGAGLISTLTTANWAMNYLADQSLPPSQRYSNQPQWKRDNYWLLPPVMGMRGQIRKPYVVGFVFGTLPERFLDWMVDHDPDAAKGLAEAALNNAVPPFMPALLAPGAELWANKNTYTGRPLVPDRLAQASGYMQYTPYTTPEAKAVAHALGPEGVNILDLPPIDIDTAIQGWGGNVPMTILRALGARWQDQPFSVADLPWLGSFFARHSVETQPVIDFYDKLKPLEQAHQDFLLSRQHGDEAGMENAEGRGALAPIAELQKAMGGQYAVLRAISQSGMTSAEKDRLTTQVANQMIEFAHLGLQVLKGLGK